MLYNWVEMLWNFVMKRGEVEETGVARRRCLKAFLGMLLLLTFVDESAFAFGAVSEGIVEFRIPSRGLTLTATVHSRGVTNSPQEAREEALKACGGIISPLNVLRTIKPCTIVAEFTNRCVGIISINPVASTTEYFITDTRAQAMAEANMRCDALTLSSVIRVCKSGVRILCSDTSTCLEVEPFLDPTDNTCKACGEMEYYDMASGTCMNLRQCPTDGSILINPLESECPSDCEETEYYDTGGRTCLPLTMCMDGTTANPTLFEVCEETCTMNGEDYDASKKMCEACPATKVLNMVSTDCECRSGEVENINSVCVLDSLSCTGGSVPNSVNTSCVCIPGEVMNADGRCVPDTLMCADGKLPNGLNDGCVCPSGEEENVNGACILSTLTCTGGKFVNIANNACVCPAGETENVDGMCITSTLTCIGGSVPNSANDECVCRSGETEDVVGRCVMDRLTCMDGRVPNTLNEECVCPMGETENVNGACVPDILSCAEGRFPNAGNDGCVCPPGETENANGTCVSSSLSCTGGKLLNITNDGCVCPAGETENVNDICVSDILSCTGGKFPNIGNNECVCRPGEAENVNGICVRSGLSCTGGKLLNITNDGCVCPSGEEENVNGICIRTALTCTGGKFPNAGNDACICRTGETENINGICVSDTLSCTGGQFPNAVNDECVCPLGETVNVNEICVSDILSCIGGRVPNAMNEVCVCPLRETENVNGVCVPDILSCTGGKFPNTVNNRCVCRPGMEEGAGGICVTSCTGGRELDGLNRCVCVRGELENINGRCVSDILGCTGGKLPNAFNDECVCVLGEVGDVNGICVVDRLRCTGGRLPNAFNDECICGVGEVENINGECVSDRLSCRGGSVPNGDNTGCECPGLKTENALGECILLCGDGKVLNASETECECPLGQTEGAGGACILICEEGRTFDEVLNECVCPPGELEDDNGECVEAEETSCSHILGGVLSNGECICLGGQERYRLLDNVEVCASILPESGSYTALECRSQGWEVGYYANLLRSIAEVCITPSVVSVLDTLPSSRGSLGVLQLAEGDSPESCIMRSHGDFSGLSGAPRCEELFGASGSFPRRPLDFRSSEDRLTVSLSRGGELIQVEFGGRDITETAETLEVESGVEQMGSSSSGSSPIAGWLALGVFGVLAWSYSSGDISLFELTPQGEYVMANGEGYYSYGSRLDFEKEEWKMSWSVLRRGEEWRYGTLAEWRGEVISASFSNRTWEMNSETRMSLSLEEEWGIWRLKTSYVGDWLLGEGIGVSWTNEIKLGGSMEYSGWTLSPVALTSWRGGERLEEGMMFGVDISREF